MKLVILGKARSFFKAAEDEEVWTVGTHKYANADKYFEFHGLAIKHKGEVVKDFPKGLEELGLPLNNSICIMLAHACEHYDFEEIRIIGSPMLAKEEYISQRAALAYIVGYYTGKGKKVIWEDLPKDNKYGRKQ